MSNLLERAIIDAKALKEVALKNAEQLVIEKYSVEVKEAMSQILEDESAEAMVDLFGDEQSAEAGMPESPEGEELEDPITTSDIESQIPDAFMSDDEEIIQIKLDSLDDEIEDEDALFGGDDKLDDDEIGIDITDDEEMDADLDASIEPDIDLGSDLGSDIGAGMDTAGLQEVIASALQDILSEEEEDEEDLNEEDKEELDEEIDLDELMERVRVEGTPQKSGWAGTPESIMKEYESMLLAREQDSEVKEENEELRKNVAALQKENKTLTSAALKLQEQNKDFTTAFNTLQEKLETMNVSNAKLLYINQALENASLNERQKRKIVEAISKAGTVQEAKIVFETMNDTVVTTSDVRKETTLSEMVSRKSSLLVAARKEQPKQEASPLFNRMQALAGIKTN
jgi:hypothetical protein